MSEIRINLHSLNFEFSNIYASISLMVSEEEESHILNKYLNSVGRSIYSLYNGKEINEFDKKVFMDIINRLRPEENADNITFGIHIAILRDLIKNIIKVKREAIRNVI
ncbi:MAG: hypothetical protein HYZ42_03460 [Bacteroidetes bacterium]|nr:hypothetical protein [Bacteroidota bacterium]